ncbi:MAG: SUMF1/EgtB/PvdO family nonheme iron enzyme [Zoogloea sp.]|nr:SUMF1/EgtB/PvdO family nonheme iron enzyme [Zoogloea sp.]
MSPRKPRKQVYVSSTFSDLEQHRAYLKLALEKAGYDVECMERYPAFDTRPADKCLADVAECDVYVVLVALRYGHIPAEDNPACKSITEMEYDKAVETTRPKLAFMLDIDDEDFGWPPKRCDKDWQDANSNIARFRERVGKELGRALFTTRESLATAVLQALRQQEIAEMPAGERDQAQIREAYLDWLRKSCNSVELLGLDLGQSADIDLEHVYVPAVTDRDVSAAPHAMESAKEGPFLLLEALGHSPLYVPGHAGSGKSTFCRWVARVVAEGQVPDHLGFPVPDDMAAFRETLPARLVGKLPILCRLRDWASYPELLTGKGWTRARLESSLSGWLDKTTPGGLTGSAFLKELSTGNCLLILDGVDEVPERIRDQFGMDHWPQDNLMVGLADAMPVWRAAGNWLLLTSRPANGPSAEQQRSLGLQTAEIAELPTELQALFVRRWFEVVQPARAEALSDGLWREMDAVGQIGVIRGNPMLLAALCAIYAHGARLPRDVLTLYDTVIQQVLCKRFKADHETARHRLAAIAFGMHGHGDGATPAAEVSKDQLDRILARFTGKDLATDDGFNAVQEIRQGLLERSGLLLSRGGGRVVFYHLSFQEFLAAEWLNRRSPPLGAVLQKYAPMPAWRLTLRFLSGFLARRGESEAVAAWRQLLPSLDPPALQCNSAAALVLADGLEVADRVGRAGPHPWSLDTFKTPLKAACEFARDRLDPPIRAELWQSQGRLGWDDRPGVGLRDGLPDIVWQDCEAGDFLYGDPGETRTLKTPFRIARYPVTHRQFQAFIDAGGYGQDEWWAGLVERPEVVPAGWSEPNAPRERVSWYEATAFCRWLDAQFRDQGLLPAGWRVSLPTEEQWERAARGTDGREYPWEGEFRSGLANVNETWGDVGPCNLGRPSPVGIYPDGKAPSGALDMAGNVWEWCRNEYEQPERCGDVGDSSRVVRGGSWFNGSVFCPAAFRSWYSPDDRNYFLGFRVCCSPPID